MMKPNWFDKENEVKMKTLTAEQVMKEIGSNAKIARAVKEALHAHDTRPNKVGPSRTQVIRTAIIEVLQAAN